MRQSPTRSPASWSSHRDGGRAQCIPRSLPEPTAHTLSATRDWALQHLDEPLTLDILARRARISTRTLVRMWRQETGATPHQWVLTARIDHARELLEATTLSVEQIADQTGLAGAPTSVPDSATASTPRPPRIAGCANAPAQAADHHHVNGSRQG
ncbi:helix-turn-helix domain-containing protein [Streptomyces griseofuscus]|uniref:helix-turn-helix domain-containing protein n=1 Tax=Streptomyces griseofuscus TaxID=146922 RepID=UPI00343F7BD9